MFIVRELVIATNRVKLVLLIIVKVRLSTVETAKVVECSIMNTRHDIGRSRSAAKRLDAKGQRPLVSVIIPHYNDIHALSICVANLHRQTWPATNMEIIVADNNSACGLDAVASA